MTTLPVALTIAGSDSGGGAGVQADLKAMSANGAFAASVITAVTAQNTLGVQGVFPLSPRQVRAQLDAVADDLPVAAVKTGMLGDAALVEAVAAGLARRAVGPVVVDPVMVATSGDSLLPQDAVASLCELLLPLATLVTPNRHEAERLAGMEIHTLADAARAAERIARYGPQAVLVKGGHLRPPAVATPAALPGHDTVVDLLWQAGEVTLLRNPRVDTRHTHGTGCTLASAIAARLACGDELEVAVREARAYLQGALTHALALGAGHGPTDHFWFVDRARRFNDAG